MEEKIRILIVDDHPTFINGISEFLKIEEITEVVGTAENGLIAIKQAKTLQPDVILMDLSMPVMGGYEATVILKKECPDSKILVLSMHEEAEHIWKLMRAGATGYALKNISLSNLLLAIKAVSQGAAYFSEEVSETLYSNKPLDENPLTKRETEILTLIAKGLSNKEIAKKINRGIRGIEAHRANIRRKLNIHPIALLALYAYKRGYVK